MHFLPKVMRYTKRPVEIEAIQFEDTPERICEISEFVGKDIHVNYNEPEHPYIAIETLEGTMKANVGDYIIKGVKGEFYPCKPDIFEQTYYRTDTPLDRMEVEIDALVDKLLKLEAFMKTDKFLALDNEIIGLLEVQYGAMMAYNHVLQLRAAKMRKEHKE